MSPVYNQLAFKLIYWLLVIFLCENIIKLFVSSSSEEKNSAKPSKQPISKFIHCDRSGRCFCPEDPLTERYPDPADPACEKYYLCHLGNAFLKKCDVRQAFHPEKRVCLSRSRVPYRACPTAVKCEKNGYIQDPQDCTMYYMCFFRQAYHYGCKEEHYYDSVKEKCILNKTSAENCQKNGKLKKEITTTTTPVPIDENDLDENEIIDLD